MPLPAWIPPIFQRYGRRVGVALLAFGLCLAGLSADRAHADWRIEDGECVERWSVGELVRGPRVVVHGAVYPIRSLLGGVFFVSTSCLTAEHIASCWWKAPLWVGASTTLGIAEGAWWLVSGALDTATLGLLRVSPHRAVELRASPTVPMLEATAYDDVSTRCVARPPRAVQP